MANLDYVNRNSTNGDLNKSKDGSVNKRFGSSSTGGGFNSSFRGGNGNSVNGRHPKNPNNRMVKSKSFPANQRHVTKVGGNEPGFEVGSVFKAGNKKQNNALDLCNFNYGTHQHHQRHHRQHPGDDHRHHHHHQESKKKISLPKRTKEHYLQANCQFVVKAEGDYGAHLGDPDIMVNWDLIEKVILKTSAAPSCPICLNEPTSAKITRCGHIYCWSCVLHYLALSDDTSRKCPICDDRVAKTDLKSVVSVPHSNFNQGDEIEMKLMRRNRESLFAMPVAEYSAELNEKHPSFSQEYNSYSKLLLANPQEVIEAVLIPEQRELLDLYRSEKDEPEACFIEEALQSLEKRMEALKTHSDALSVMPPFENLCVGSRPRHSSSTSSESGSVIVNQLSDEDFASNPFVSNGAKPKKPVKKENFYFYQSSDGQMIFLHGLNAKMLERQFGDLEYAPPVIRGKILEKESVCITEELRHKFRYLRHLPVSCNVEFLELQLDRDVVDFDVSVMREFETTINERRKRRQKKSRAEKNREKKIAVEENKLMGKYPENKVRIQSEFHFPGINSTADPLPNGRVSADDDDEMDGEESALSYSKMIREGKKMKEPPIILRDEAFPAPSWGLGAVALSKSANYNAMTTNETEKREPDDDDEKPAPPASFSFSTNNFVTKGSGGGKKKKGGKKTLLVLQSAPRPQMN